MKICPNCHDANSCGDYEGPTCEVCHGEGHVPSFTPCSALVNGVCTNGFPAVPCCGHTELIGGDYSMPFCLSDTLPFRSFPETGAPSREQVERARKRATETKSSAVR